MAQHDQVIDDGQGSVVRADINAAFAAIFSSSSGAAEPLVIVPGQLWFDISAAPPALKCRNANNDAWIDVVFGDTTAYAPSPIIDEDQPDSGSYGQIWIDPSNGKMFVWMGGTDGWVPVGGGGGTVDTSDQPPTEPDDSQFWFDSASGALYLYYRDVDGAQWVQVSATPAASGSGIAEAPQDGNAYGRKNGGWVGVNLTTAIPKNLAVNPCFQISQQNGGGLGTASGFYPADQWFMSYTGTFNVAVGNDMNSSNRDSGSVGLINFQPQAAKTSLAAADVFGLVTRIEGNRIQSLNLGGVGMSKQFLIRFMCITSVEGDYTVAVKRPDNAQCWIGQFHAPAFEDTEVVLAVPPTITNGAWKNDNSLGMEVWITLACGTTSKAPNTGWQMGNFMACPTQANLFLNGSPDYFNIHDFAIYADPKETGIAPPFVVPDYDDSLRDCMRYFEKSYNQETTPGTITDIGTITWQAATATTSPFQSNATFQVPKRVAPTMTFYNPVSGVVASVRNVTQSANVAVNSLFYTSQKTTGYVGIGTAPTAGAQFNHHFVANARM